MRSLDQKLFTKNTRELNLYLKCLNYFPESESPSTNKANFAVSVQKFEACSCTASPLQNSKWWGVFPNQFWNFWSSWTLFNDWVRPRRVIPSRPFEKLDWRLQLQISGLTRSRNPDQVVLGNGKGYLILVAYVVVKGLVVQPSTSLCPISPVGQQTRSSRQKIPWANMLRQEWRVPRLRLIYIGNIGSQVLCKAPSLSRIKPSS